jgi:Zn-dependent protease with chaperone function
VDASPLWALQVGTVIAWFWWATTLVSWLQGIWNRLILSLPFPISLRGLVIRADLTWFVVLLGLGLALASPWILDRLLRRLLHPFSLEELGQYSPEAVRLLKRVFGQRRQPVLRLLSSDAPLALTYGWLPQITRLVVSRGALRQLNAEELATLYAAELGHLRHGNAQVLSSLAMVTQLPYQAYCQIATWGDRQHDRVLQSLAVIGSSVSYGAYWLLRLPLLGLSRIRHYYSDRLASDLTGNPNALIRTELKLSLGISEATQRQQASAPLLEALDLLLPVSYRAALSLGSVYPQHPTPNLLEWDRRHPYRAWLALNQSHPPLGQRLHWLTHYARHWRLEPELDWASLSASSAASGPLTRQFLLQAAPFLGIPIGLAVALGLWGIGWLALRLRWLELGWLWGDPSLLWGGGLLGFSMGTMLRINPFFPDIHQAAPRPLDLAGLLSQKNALPVDSQPGCWQGQLLGRPGLANWLYPDLMLHTSTGTIRLHFTTRFGVASNLLLQRLRPTQLLGQTVTVTGWLRRGVIPWIDVETLRTTRGTIRSHHPVASTVLAVAAALLGLAIILRG